MAFRAAIRYGLIGLVCVALLAALVFVVLVVIAIQERDASLGWLGVVGFFASLAIAILLSRGARFLRWSMIRADVAEYTRELRSSAFAPVALFNDGIASTWNGDHARAIACFEEAIRLEPMLLPYAYIGRVNSYGALGQFDRMIAMATEQIRAEPEDAFEYCVRATAYNGIGRWDLAIPDATAAIRLAPSLFLGHDARGHAYLQRGSFHPLLKAVAIAWMLATFGFLRRDRFDWRTPCGSRNDFELAIADFTEAIRLHPQAWDCHSGRAKAHRALGNHSKAMADEAAVPGPD